MRATLNAITLAPILFLLCAAVGVTIMNRARRDLTVEQKAAIFDAAPKRQSWLLAAMALVMAAFRRSSMSKASSTLYGARRGVIKCRCYTTNFAPVSETTVDVICLANA